MENIYEADEKTLTTLRDDLGWCDSNEGLIDKLVITVMVLCKRVEKLEKDANKQ